VAIVATNDWKAELKRRIADIKEKKKSEESVKEKAKSYLEKQRRATEFEQALEERKPAREDSAKTADSTRKKQPASAEQNSKKTQKPTEKKHGAPVEESLFQLNDPEPVEEVEEIESSDSDSEREAAIKRALQRFSRASETVDQQESKNSSNKRAEESDVTEAAEAQPPSEPAADALKNISEARQRMEISLDDAINKDLPVDDSVKTSGDFLRHGPSLQIEDFEEDDNEEKDLFEETRIDKSGHHIAGLRLAATSIDLAVSAILTAGLAWIASMIMATDILSVLAASWLPLTGLLAVIHGLYYTTFTSSSGQTIGKMIFRIQVAQSDNNSIGILRAVSRWVINLFSLAFLGIGLLMAFLTPKARTAADAILKQRVVKQEEDQ
jgi:uncharacterized RDD family membrane protein YckC